MGRDEEQIQVSSDGLIADARRRRRDRIPRFLTVILLALGLVAVVASFVPDLRGGIRVPERADIAWAPLMVSGLLLLLAAATAIGLGVGFRAGRGRSLRIELALAASIPFAIAGLLIATHVSELSSPALPSPPMLVAVVVASLAVGVALPVGLWMAHRSRGHPVSVPTISRRAEVALIGLVVLVFASAVALGVRQAVPFGWDESVYALISRHWLFGTPATGWGIHRPPVLSILASIPMLVTRNESAFRAIGLLAGCMAVAAVWLVGRRLHGILTGVVAAAVVASAQPIQINSGFLLNDVPATGLLLLLIATLWRVMEDERAGWSILWLAPIAVLAFYVRYGASVAILAIAVTALLVWPRRIAADWPKAVATAGLLVVLVIPHLVFSIMQTGSPWGIALAASGGAHSAYPGEAIVTYLVWLPYRLVGPLGAAVAIVGLLTCVVAIVRALRLRRWDRTARAFSILLVPAAAQIAVLGVTILPVGRYIYLAMILLIIAGCAGLVTAWSRLANGRRLVAWLGTGVLVAYLLGSVALVTGVAERGLSSTWLRDGGRYIAAHSSEGCSVLGSYLPQITWYSGCATYSFGDGTRADRDARLSGEDRWLVVRRDGVFQPATGILDQYLSRVVPGSQVLLKDGSGVVRAALYRFAPAGG
jgi:4-amino-4-deoxy-L-arabinose transferase-like glycosyltransferase